MANIPRMVPIKKAAAETGLAYEHIRKLCLRKKIVHIKAGRKYLINMDKFADYLNGEETNAATEKGGINDR